MKCDERQQRKGRKYEKGETGDDKGRQHDRAEERGYRHTAQKAQEIPGVKYPVGKTRCILWCIPTFGVFLALFGVFRMMYSQSNKHLHAALSP
jgi:hypothetical protein